MGNTTANNEYIEYKNFAVKLAEATGKILMEYRQKKFRIDFKENDKHNVVTEVDHLAEKFIVEAIKNQYPNHCVLSEEGGDCGLKPSNYRWLIDPIDGTVNFAHGFNCFCISIALEKDGELIAAAIHSPMMDETFSASKGGGSFLNETKIAVSTIDQPELALISLATSKFLPHFKKVQGIRRTGSCAINLAYTACGRLDASISQKIYAWDIAAGILIIEEAGGKVTTNQGEKIILNQGHGQPYKIVASNNLIHPYLLQQIQKANSTAI